MTKFEDWTFDELVTHACWQFIEDLTKGQSLRSTLHQTLQIAIRWRELQIAKEKKGKRRR